jgi:hypothetical protein
MRLLVPIIALATILMLGGCYTQFGAVGEEDLFAEFPEDEVIVAQEAPAADDTSQVSENDYAAARDQFYYDYYYPPVSVGIGFGYPSYWYGPYWDPWYGYYGSPYYWGYASYWYSGGGWYPTWCCGYYPVDPYPPYPVAPVAYATSRTAGTTRGGGTRTGGVTRGGRLPSTASPAVRLDGARSLGSRGQVTARSDG